MHKLLIQRQLKLPRCKVHGNGFALYHTYEECFNSTLGMGQRSLPVKHEWNQPCLQGTTFVFERLEEEIH